MNDILALRANDERPVVLVFTERVLALSETFIADHCRSLKRFRYVLVGIEKASPELYPDLDIRLIFGDQGPTRVQRALWRFGYCPEMDSLIRDIRPSLIHAHYSMNGAFMLPYAKRHGIPLFVTLHGYDITRKMRPFSLYSWAFMCREPALKRSAAAVLPVSNFLLDIALARGYSLENMKTHYLGIPIPGDRARKEQGVCKAIRRISFVGRLVEKKGIDNVLAAYKLALEFYPDLELHIVGDGPLRELVTAAVSEFSGITWHGALPHHRVIEVLREASVFCMPSRIASDGDAEGFGLVLLEAQSVGVPAITSNVSGTKEAILDGETGILVDPESIEEILQAFVSIFRDSERLMLMSSNAADFVRRRFDIARRTELLEDMYIEEM